MPLEVIMPKLCKNLWNSNKATLKMVNVSRLSSLAKDRNPKNTTIRTEMSVEYSFLNGNDNPFGLHNCLKGPDIHLTSCIVGTLLSSLNISPKNIPWSTSPAGWVCVGITVASTKIGP